MRHAQYNLQVPIFLFSQQPQLLPLSACGKMGNLLALIVLALLCCLFFAPNFGLTGSFLHVPRNNYCLLRTCVCFLSFLCCKFTKPDHAAGVEMTVFWAKLKKLKPPKMIRNARRRSRHCSARRPSKCRAATRFKIAAAKLGAVPLPAAGGRLDH